MAAQIRAYFELDTSVPARLPVLLKAMVVRLLLGKAEYSSQNYWWLV
jgi:hypothetical protein